jgi:hypothetical protein
MTHILTLILNKPGEAAAITTQEYNSLEAAMNAREVFLDHSRITTVYTLYVLVTEKGKVAL